MATDFHTRSKKLLSASPRNELIASDKPSPSAEDFTENPERYPRLEDRIRSSPEGPRSCLNPGEHWYFPRTIPCHVPK